MLAIGVAETGIHLAKKTLTKVHCTVMSTGLWSLNKGPLMESQVLKGY